MLRDGFHQDAVHGGAAPYRPNSVDGGGPFLAGHDDHPFIDLPAPVEAGVKERAHPASFEDHFSQVTLFYRSLTPVEQDHISAAYTFELSKCYDQTIRERQLQALANIDAGLCQQVADGLGLQVPKTTVPIDDVVPSAALTQIGRTWPVAGRQVGIIVGAAVKAKAVTAVVEAAQAAGAVALVVGPHGGRIGELTVHRTYANAASVEFDALVLIGDLPPAPDAMVSSDAKAGAPAAVSDPRVVKLVGEAWRHAKAIGVIEAETTLVETGATPFDVGIAVGTAKQVAPKLLKLLGQHRAWDRFATSVA
jgi:catalase